MARVLPWFAFYPADWTGDAQLSMASFATQGIWMRALCIMFYAPEPGKVIGTLDQLARAIGCSRDETVTFIAEARQLGFATIVDLPDDRIEIVCRRMQRDVVAHEKKRTSTAERQRRHRNGRGHTNVTPDTTRAVTGDSRAIRPGESESESNNSKTATRRPRKPSPGSRAWPFGDESSAPTGWWIERAQRLGLDATRTAREWRDWRGVCISHGLKYVDWKVASIGRLLREVEKKPPVSGQVSGSSASAIPDSRDVLAKQREAVL